MAQRSNIEVFFRVLGAESTRKAFSDVASASTGAAGRIARFGSSVGGALASATRQALELSRTVGLIGLGGLAALSKGIKDTVDSSAELTSVVLALRAVNGEIDKASGLPQFSAAAGGGLFDAAGAGARNTAADLAFLNKLADQTGVAVKDLAGNYVQLTASTSKSNIALDDARNVFTGVADAALVLGRSNEEAGRAFTALQQIASKGVVQSEELKGQLAEALPGTIPLAAQAFGYGDNIKAFLKQVESGSVSAVEFFRRVGRALVDNYGKAAIAAADTTRVALGRLKNAFFNAKVAIGNGPLDAEVRRILNNITKLFNQLLANGAFARLGAKLAASLRPLVDRFEAAVNGGFDFERVLNLIGATADKLIAAVGVVVDIVGSLARSLGNLRAIFASYGVTIRPVGQILVGIALAFERITASIATRQWTDSGFLDFFVSVYLVVESLVAAIGRIVAPRVGPGLQTLEQTFSRIAQWLNQLAAAIDTLSTGQISPTLNDTGAGILVYLTLTVDKVRQLIDLLKTAGALISGQAAPKNAPLETQRTFARRDALGDLVSGRPNVERVNEAGRQLYDPGEFSTLFKLRDIVVNIVDFVYQNRGAIGALFDGVADAIGGLTAALKPLSDLLAPIAAALGFENINVAIGYAFGLYLVLSRVYGVVGLIRTAFAALAVSQISFGATMSLTVPQFAAILAIIGGVLFIIGKIVSNWRLLRDEIGNIITLIGAGLTSAIAGIIRGIAGLLSYIPVVGGQISKSLNGFADRLEEGVAAARRNVYLTSVERTSQRQVENGGRDPYSAAGPTGFGAFGFLANDGAAKALGDLGTKQEAANDTLRQIAAQNDAAAANDNADAIGRSVAANIVAAQGGTLQPTNITLPDTGAVVRMYGTPQDVATLEQYAAQAARNRPGQRPAWAGN